MGTQLTVQERVERGAAWLDENKPGWHHLIDLGGLDLGCGENCVLGQLFALETCEGSVHSRRCKNGYAFALDHLVGDGNGATYYWAVSHGFLAGDGDSGFDLDEAWIKLIKERCNQ